MDDLFLSYCLWNFKAGLSTSRIAFVQIVNGFMMFGFDTMRDRVALRRYAANVSDKQADGLSMVIQVQESGVSIEQNNDVRRGTAIFFSWPRMHRGVRSIFSQSVRTL